MGSYCIGGAYPPTCSSQCLTGCCYCSGAVCSKCQPGYQLNTATGTCSACQTGMPESPLTSVLTRGCYRLVLVVHRCLLGVYSSPDVFQRDSVQYDMSCLQLLLWRSMRECPTHWSANISSNIRHHVCTKSVADTVSDGTDVSPDPHLSIL